MICPIFLDPWPEHWLIPGKSLVVFSYRLLDEDDELDDLDAELDELDARIEEALDGPEEEDDDE